MTKPVRTITPPIVARWLQVTDATVLRWIRTKELPAMNIGTRGNLPRFRIFKRDLVTFMRARGVPADTVQELLKF